MNKKLDKEFKEIFDKAMEPAIAIVKEVGNILTKQKHELILEMLNDYKKYITKDTNTEFYKKWKMMADEIL